MSKVGSSEASSCIYSHVCYPEDGTRFFIWLRYRSLNFASSESFSFLIKGVGLLLSIITILGENLPSLDLISDLVIRWLGMEDWFKKSFVRVVVLYTLLLITDLLKRLQAWQSSTTFLVNCFRKLVSKAGELRVEEGMVKAGRFADFDFFLSSSNFRFLLSMRGLILS